MVGLSRKSLICDQATPRVTGIDFIQVVDPSDQRVLRVFFLVDPDSLVPPMVAPAPLPAPADPGSVTIESVSGGESIASVDVVAATWDSVATGAGPRTVLELTVDRPGDFSRYRLTVHDPLHRVDRFFNGVEFSFKQGCPSDFDCQQETTCPQEAGPSVTIDYLARDFPSLSSALLDFASQRYPEWREKIPADVGVMLLEVMAALGDELSYVQDRYAREAFLETATQRRSLRGLARLVDYEPDPGRSATTKLALTVSQTGLGLDQGVSIAAVDRALVWATPESGQPVPFEVGTGLQDGSSYWVHSAWNAMALHVPDPSQPCLAVGATELFLAGRFPSAAQTPPVVPGQDPIDPMLLWIGREMVILTQPDDPWEPQRRWGVRVTHVEHISDAVRVDEFGNPVDVTRVVWDEADALPFEVCQRDAVLLGNVVPAVAGRTVVEAFQIGPVDVAVLGAASLPSAIERQGPCDSTTGDRAIAIRFGLSETEEDALGWLVNDQGVVTPEVVLREFPDAVEVANNMVFEWRYVSTLLDGASQDRVYTVEPGSWRKIVRYERLGFELDHRDYAADAGFSLRFGDGEFGRTPADGTLFEVTYRTGAGKAVNLPSDAVTTLIEPGQSAAHTALVDIEAVTNPFAITDGADPESAERVRQRAPQQYRALPLRAVRLEDYQEIAQRLDWVQQAGAAARWTGSWTTRYITADPLDAFALSEDRRSGLSELMDCVRQVGHEVHVTEPAFVSLDIEVEICVDPSAYPGQVKEAVVEALAGGPALQQPPPFFHPDHFTFGTPLRRSALVAAVQNVPGVRAVERVCVRQRGRSGWQVFSDPELTIEDGAIFRLQNDATLPERGSLRVRSQHDPDNLRGCVI